MMLTPLQLPSVYDGCARDAEENRMRKEFGRQNIIQEKLNVIYTFR